MLHDSHIWLRLASNALEHQLLHIGAEQTWIFTSQEMPSTKMSAFLLHFLHLYPQCVQKIGSFWFDPSFFFASIAKPCNLHTFQGKTLFCANDVFDLGNAVWPVGSCTANTLAMCDVKVPLQQECHKQTAYVWHLSKSKGSIRTVKQEPQAMMCKK